MAPNSKDIAALIIDYLKKVVERKEVSDDSSDNLNVAIDCIMEAFDIDINSIKTIVRSAFDNNDLTSLIPVSKMLPGESIEAKKYNSHEVNEKAEILKIEGNKEMLSKNYKAAMELYSEAIRTDYTQAAYYTNRSIAYAMLDEYGSAINDANKAITIDPFYSKAYTRLGFANFAQGNFVDALHAYKKVLDIEGDKASESMKTNYETAKMKVEQSLYSEKLSSKSGSKIKNKVKLEDIISMAGNNLNAIWNNTPLRQVTESILKQYPNAEQQVNNIMQDPSMIQMMKNIREGKDGAFLNNLPDMRNLISSIVRKSANLSPINDATMDEKS